MNFNDTTKALIKDIAAGRKEDEVTAIEDWASDRLYLPFNRAIERFDESLGTGWFTGVVANVAHNKLIKGYNAAPDDWRKVCSSIISLEDMKQRSVTAFSGLPYFKEKKEHEAFESANFVDRREYYTPAEYGRIFSITMTAKANDAIGAFNQWAEREGKAATETLNRFVFYTLMDANPTMISDSNSLFDTTNHSNVNASSTVGRASVEAAIELLLAQTGDGGEKIRLKPRYYVVDPTTAMVAYDMVSTIYKRTTTGSASVVTGEPNIVGSQGRFPLEIIVSPDIATAGDSYLVADPATTPTWEIGFLNGQQTPQLLQENPASSVSFSHNVMRFRVSMVFGGFPVDWRGMVFLDQ